MSPSACSCGSYFRLLGITEITAWSRRGFPKLCHVMWSWLSYPPNIRNSGTPLWKTLVKPCIPVVPWNALVHFPPSLVLHPSMRHVSSHLKSRRVEWTCPLCKTSCVSPKNTSETADTLVPSNNVGSNGASMGNSNLMFSGCSRVQVITLRNKLKYQRQMDFARLSVCLHF